MNLEIMQPSIGGLALLPGISHMPLTLMSANAFVAALRPF